MNWLVIAVVGTAAAWFEYNYQRSRRRKKHPADKPPDGSALQASETAHTAPPSEIPAISPNPENDKKLNTTV